MLKGKKAKTRIALILAAVVMLGSMAWFTPESTKTSYAEGRMASTTLIASTPPDASASPDASATPEASEEPTVAPTEEPTEEPVPTPPPAPVKIGAKLSPTEKCVMAGTKFKLKVTVPAVVRTDGSTVKPDVKYSSTKKGVATVTSSGKVTAKKAGVAEIRVVVGSDTLGVIEETLVCRVTVVAKMSKTDFSMYNTDNLINRWTKKKWKYAWTGEWESFVTKYGSTYRGVKIGMKLKEVEERYGEFKTKKCEKSKDPFLYEKHFNNSKKQLKVSKYADFVYKKIYCIRVYFTPGDKVFGFTFTKDIKKIKKSFLASSNGGRLSMV